MPPLYLRKGSFFVQKMGSTTELAATERTLLKLGTSRKYEFTAYAADETEWRMRYERPGFSIWTRLFREYKIVVPVQWDRSGRYHIDELRAALLKAVEHNDNVPPQSVERDDLLNRLRAAATFKEFVEIWKGLGNDYAPRK
jgi:hypothetical protein